MHQITRFFLRSLLKRSSKEKLATYPPLAILQFDSISRSILVNGYYEAFQLQAIGRQVLSSIKSRRTFVDIGANIGNHSVYLAPEFEQVYSFEPNRRTFMLLQANAMLRSNISTFNIGLSDRKETRQVVFSPANVGAASVERESLPENSQRASFELDRLDDLPMLKNRTDIDLIKIDVEGHELEALKGAEETLKRCTPCICMEVLKTEVEDGSSKSLQFLKSIGYSHFYTFESSYDRDNISGLSAWLKWFYHAIFLNHRLDKELSIKPITELKYKHYPLVICSHQDLVQR